MWILLVEYIVTFNKVAAVDVELPDAKPSDECVALDESEFT